MIRRLISKISSRLYDTACNQNDLTLEVETLEQRQMLSGSANSAAQYEPEVDPSVAAIVTAFIVNDPENANDSYDIRTNWISAVDEIASIGIPEVTFAVYRNVSSGNLVGGPSIETVRAAVDQANAQGLSVTILPVFEANGWRGNYDPSGNRQARFQSQYTELVSQLASINGIDRFNIGSELNAMVENPNNFGFFTNLISVARNSLNSSGNQQTQIGYAANFDAYQNSEHVRLLTHTGIDFMGVSAYRSIINAADANLVSGIGEIPQTVFDRMVENWSLELDGLSNFAAANNLPIIIQEAGAVQQNYASVAPFAVNPSDWVSGRFPNRYQADPYEQRAVYESLIHALDGRGDEFESVNFWTWEHGASRGRRTMETLNTNGTQERFAIWPTDGGAGEYLTGYVATGSLPTPTPNQNNRLEVLVRGSTGQESFNIKIDNEVVASFDNIGTSLRVFQFDAATDISADQVRIEFTNDFLDLERGINRTLYVDAIRIGGADGELYRADSEDTFISGTYIGGVGRSEGYLQTGALHTNGFVRFADRNRSGSTIDILASGKTGNELIEIVVNGEAVGQFDLRRKEDLYRVSIDRQIRAGDNIQIRFVNDLYDASTGENRAVNVDKIFVDQRKFETEAPTTFSTGTWKPNIGFVPGFVQSEWLNGSGHFRFDI